MLRALTSRVTPYRLSYSPIITVPLVIENVKNSFTCTHIPAYIDGASQIFDISGKPSDLSPLSPHLAISQRWHIMLFSAGRHRKEFVKHSCTSVYGPMVIMWRTWSEATNRTVEIWSTLTCVWNLLITRWILIGDDYYKYAKTVFNSQNFDSK